MDDGLFLDFKKPCSRCLVHLFSLTSRVHTRRSSLGWLSHIVTGSLNKRAIQVSGRTRLCAYEQHTVTVVTELAAESRYDACSLRPSSAHCSRAHVVRSIQLCPALRCVL